jgi:hypothetical protein
MPLIEWKRTGVMREVLLIGRWAVKLPKLTRCWRNFLQGLLANMQERELFARGYAQLCPVVFSIPGGWLVVMRRAEPLTDKFLEDFDMEQFTELADGTMLDIEMKGDTFGMLDGHPVVVDYGGVP